MWLHRLREAYVSEGLVMARISLVIIGTYFGRALGWSLLPNRPTNNDRLHLFLMTRQLLSLRMFAPCSVLQLVFTILSAQMSVTLGTSDDTPSVLELP